MSEETKTESTADSTVETLDKERAEWAQKEIQYNNFIVSLKETIISLNLEKYAPRQG